MMLEVKGVRVKIKSSEILRDITFGIGEGEMVALLGPNGSGKTTLLRTIYGILKPEKGVLFLKKMNLNQLSIEEIAREIGYLPQEKAATQLKAGDVVLLGRTSYSRKPTESDVEMAKKALKDVKLDDFYDRPFSQLSGGEKQKILLARVFAQETGVFLLDEPTAHLDISSQIEILEILKMKVSEGKSALVALHDVNMATAFFDRILMTKGGRIVCAGSSDIITPESIRDVFSANVIVRRHGGRPFVIPFLKSPTIDGGQLQSSFGEDSLSASKKSSCKKRVHIICGGGSGRGVIRTLKDSGYCVSAGVLNTLDSDFELIAEEGGMEIVSEAPFSHISEEAHLTNLEMIRKSDAVILADVYIGEGNLLNLEAALSAAESGKLIVVNLTPFRKRNFSGDKAKEIFDKLLEKAVEVKDEKKLIQAVEGLLR